MAEEDQDQKTEQPTGKRLSEAHEKGQIPVSREVSSWVIFLGILLVVTSLAPAMMVRLIDILRTLIEMPPAMGIDDRQLQTILFDVIMQVVLATGLVFALMMFVSVLGTMVQTGFFASLEKLKPDFERLMPMQGIKRLFSTGSLVEAGKSFVKLVILGTVVFYTLWPLMSEMAMLSQRPMMESVIFLYRQMIRLITIILLVYGVVAIMDIVYERFKFIKNLKMTKAEVKDEYKQQEGDPAIKGRLRQLRVEKARKRMMAQVPKADVIITNPTHYAVALQYDGAKMAAPTVIAKGINLVAERIRDIATEHGIPLVSNPPLARALHESVEIDRQIPSEHYKAVAEVISYVYKLKKRRL